MYKKVPCRVLSKVICNLKGNVKYDIYYPVIAEPDTVACNSINNFSRFGAKMTEKYIEENILPVCQKETSQFNILRIFETMYSSRFLVSFKYEMNCISKELENIYYTEGVVWNIKTGNRVKLKEFFRGNVRYKEIILYILMGKIKERLSKGEKFPPDIQARLAGNFCLENFYLCPEGFVFVFPPKALKDEENRAEEILISFMEIKNQIKTVLL